MSKCNLCPRGCDVDREVRRGFCGEGEKIRIARAALHPFEEPCISGTQGSGTIFFCGCNLRCVFCQNMQVSRGEIGREISEDELCRIMLDLKAKGAENINLVTPSHFVASVASALKRVKGELGLPVVYNSGGYESLEALKMLDGLVDVYLPDFKYASPSLARDYSNAEDYPLVAAQAVKEMYRQVGEVKFDSRGIMQKGVMVRHLVLPSCRHDSIEVLQRLSELLPTDKIRLSLMSQYTPSFASECRFPNLKRKLTTFEYNSVLSKALELGFDGYFQDPSSATEEYTPTWDGEN